MSNWVYCKNYKQVDKLLNLLSKKGFKGGEGCYILSNPKYVYYDLSRMTCFRGARFPSSIKIQNIQDFKSAYNRIKFLTKIKEV